MLEQYAFGSGKLYMRPLGSAIAQPVQVGTLQETSFDFDWSDKPLQGELDAPAYIARGALKISGKIKSAKFSAKDLSQVVFGTTPTTGTTLVASDEGLPNGITVPVPVTLDTSASTASGSTLPFTSTAGVAVGQAASNANIPAGAVVASIIANTSVTLSEPISGVVASASPVVFGPSITVANAATFIDDLGIINLNTGMQLTPVTSAPATGEYSVSNGTYLFAEADAAAGLVVTPSYEYSQAEAGSGFTYYAQPMGFRPTFKLVLSNQGLMNDPAFSGQPLSMTLWSVGINKFSLDFKNEDWTIPETDFSAAADFMKRVYTIGADQ